MTKHLNNTPLRALLPGSVANDATITAAASALDGVLRATALSMPNLLLYARLNNQPVDSLLPPLARLTQARGGLAPLSLDELEQLAWQFHVDFREVAQTPEQLAAMVRSAIAWHRFKGTPASIKKALNLFGYSGITIEEDGTGKHWATYQLGLPQIATPEAVRHIVTICNEMAPARCRLWRITTEAFDRRPIIVSRGPRLGDGWLSFYSGVSVETPEGDVIVSFGTRNAYQAEAYANDPLCASFGSIIHLGFLAPYLDRFVVGRSGLSFPYPRNHGFAMGSLFSILWADRATTARRWQGEWDARCWLDYTGFDRKLPPWRMGRRGLSRAQLVPGWGEVLSQHNARLGASFAVTIDNPAKLGAARLSVHNPERHLVRLHELFIHSAGHETPPVEPGIPATAGGSCLSVASSVPNPCRMREVRHDEAALRMAARNPQPPRDALHSLAPLLAQTLGPADSPPAAVASFRAPLWRGSWLEPGRTWRTETLLSVH